MLEMVADAPAGAHATAGNNNRALFHFIDCHGFLSRLADLQRGQKTLQGFTADIGQAAHILLIENMQPVVINPGYFCRHGAVQINIPVCQLAGMV